MSGNRILVVGSRGNRRTKLYLRSGRYPVDTHHLKYSILPFFASHHEALSKAFPEGLELADETADASTVRSNDYLLWYQPQATDQTIMSELLEAFEPSRRAILHYENPVAYHFRRWIFQSGLDSKFSKVFSSTAALVDSDKYYWVPGWNYLNNFETGEPVTPLENTGSWREHCLAINPVLSGWDVSPVRKKILDHFVENSKQCAVYGQESAIPQSDADRWKKRYCGPIPFGETPYRFTEKIEIFKKYRFILVVENAFTHFYLTEKLGEPLAALCVPIYFGDPDIEEHLPELFDQGVINGHRFDSLAQLSAYIEGMPAKEYLARVQQIKDHRHRYFLLTDYKRIWEFSLAHLLGCSDIYDFTPLGEINKKLSLDNASLIGQQRRSELVNLLHSQAEGSEYDNKARKLLWRHLKANRGLCADLLMS